MLLCGCSQISSLRLEELHEKIVLEVAGEKVTPMVANPGRILLTSQRLYFQPFNNAEVVSLHHSVMLCGVVCVCCRYNFTANGLFTVELCKMVAYRPPDLTISVRCSTVLTC